MKWQAPKEFDKVSLWKSRFVRRLKQNCNWGSCFLWLLSSPGDEAVSCALFLVCTHCCLSLWYLLCKELWQAVGKLTLLDSFPSKINPGFLNFDGKMDFCACSLYVHLHSKTATFKYNTRKRDLSLVSAFHWNWLQGQTPTIAQQRENNTLE